MKIQMAPNSLFAILLRQPWWVSLVIAAVLALVAAALLPDDLKVVGALSGLPIFVLSMVALKRQWKLPGAAEVEAVNQAVRQMPWEAFRVLLELAFVREGYQVSPGQGAIDLVLAKPGRRVLVSARRWKAARQGEETLQAVCEAADRSDDGGSVMLVTLGELTPGARQLATVRQVVVVGSAELARLLRGLPLPQAGSPS